MRGLGICSQAWPPAFDPQDTYGGRSQLELTFAAHHTSKIVFKKICLSPIFRPYVSFTPAIVSFALQKLFNPFCQFLLFCPGFLKTYSGNHCLCVHLEVFSIWFLLACWSFIIHEGLWRFELIFIDYRKGLVSVFYMWLASLHRPTCGGGIFCLVYALGTIVKNWSLFPSPLMWCPWLFLWLYNIGLLLWLPKSDILLLPALLLLLGTALAIQSLLYFYLNFMFLFSSSVKNVSGILMVFDIIWYELKKLSTET